MKRTKFDWLSNDVKQAVGTTLLTISATMLVAPFIATETYYLFDFTWGSAEIYFLESALFVLFGIAAIASKQRTIVDDWGYRKVELTKSVRIWPEPKINIELHIDEDKVEVRSGNQTLLHKRKGSNKKR